MSQTPNNENLSQSFLYAVGKNHMDEDAAVNAPDVDVRWEGYYKVREIALGGVAVATLSAGLLALGTWAFDHSPTMTRNERTLNESVVHSHNPAHLHTDPQQAVVNVRPPVSR